MKKHLPLWTLLAGAVVYQAADCIPSSYIRYAETLTNCTITAALYPSLYKETHPTVVFPDGYKKDVNPGGTGECEQAGDCDVFTNYLKARDGMTKCWPQFLGEQRVPGKWSQQVVDRIVVPKVTICSNGIPVYTEITCANKPVQRPPVAVIHSCDLDHDGYTVAQGDCNDSNNLIFPGAFPRCNSSTPSIDRNCDGRSDIEVCSPGCISCHY